MLRGVVRCIDLFPEPVVVTDPDGRVLAVNRSCDDLFALVPGDCVRSGLGVRRVVWASWCDSAALSDVACPIRLRQESPDRFFAGRVLALRDDESDVVAFALLFNPPSRGEFERLSSELRSAKQALFQQQRLQADLEAQRARLATLLDAMPLGALELDNHGRVIDCNYAFAELAGAAIHDIVGSMVDRWIAGDNATEERITGRQPAVRGPIAQGVPSIVGAPSPAFGTLRNASGGDVAVKVDWSILPMPGTLHGYVCVVSDVREQLALTEELHRRADRDEMTGLFNRRALTTRAEAELARLRRYGGSAALALFDLDHFKSVNDTRGHGAGDAALEHFADVLREACRDVDVAGRWGGEEFLVLLPATDADAASHFAERVRSGIAGSSVPGLEPPLVVTVSAGVAALHDEPRGFEEAVRRADDALYRAKAAGRNRVAR